jgi:hypothetical protein
VFVKRIFLVISLALATSAAHANKLDFYLSGGATLSNLKNNSTVQITNSITDIYSTHSGQTIGPLFGLGMGSCFNNIFNRSFDFSLGLTGYYVYFHNISGTKYPFANDGSYDTLNYQFKAYSLALMVEPRVIYTAYSWQPFLLAGMGGSWNYLYNYSETPTNNLDSAAPVPQAFASHGNLAFAYELGLGVQHPIFEDRYKIKYLISLDYRYMRFGKGQLGSFPAQTSASRLHLSNLNTQAVVFTLKASV